MTDAIDGGRSPAELPHDRRGDSEAPRFAPTLQPGHGLTSEGRFSAALRIVEQRAALQTADANLSIPGEVTASEALSDGEPQPHIVAVERQVSREVDPLWQDGHLQSPWSADGSVITRAFQARARGDREQHSLISGLAALVRTDAALPNSPNSSPAGGAAELQLEKVVTVVREFAEHLQLVHDADGNVSEIRFHLAKSRFGPAAVTCRMDAGELVVVVVTETQITAELAESLAHELRQALSRIFSNPRIKIGNPAGNQADIQDSRKPDRYRPDDEE